MQIQDLNDNGCLKGSINKFSWVVVLFFFLFFFFVFVFVLFVFFGGGMKLAKYSHF